MTRRAERAVSDGRHGMKRSTQMAITAGVVVFLSLTSGISFAAWTASSSKTATASAGKIAVITGTSAGSNTISTLGPHTYTATGQTVTKPITVRNTGSVPASLSSVTITRSGSLPGSEITAKIWAGSTSACAVTAPVITSSLSAGTLPLGSLNMTIAAGGSAILCASTTFNGSVSAQAGKSVTAIVVLSTSAGANWTANDSQSETNRTFTQQIYTINPPTNVQCEAPKKNKVDISWTAPVGFMTPNNGYNIYYDGVYEATTADTTFEIADKNKDGDSWLVTIRAVDSNGVESADSQAILIEPEKKDKGISCGS